MKRLIHIDDDRVLRQIPLVKARYTLGRDSDNDIVFDVPRVSRRHAELLEERGGYTVVDAESANHVYVNGVQVRRHELRSGDVLSLSRRAVLIYLSESSEDRRVARMLERMWDSINKEDFLRLKEVTGKIIALDDLGSILRVILLEVIRLVKADRGFIALTGPDGTFQPSGCVTHKIELDDQGLPRVFSQSVVQQAITRGRKVFLLRGADTETEELSESIVELSLSSVMCAPLQFDDKLVGVLYVDADLRLDEFDRIDQLFFTILSDHAAIAIDNARRTSEGRVSLKRARREARLSEERYQLLVELSPDAIIVVRAGEIAFANAAAASLLGAAGRDQLLGREVMELAHADYRDVLTRLLDARDGPPRAPVEALFDRLDGGTVEVELVGTALAAGGPAETLLIARDIGERKRLEAEMLRSHKLESLGVLAGGIAHDFNNLLAAILGNISLARESADDAEARADTLHEAEQACRRARGLTQQLLTFSRGGAPVRHTAPLTELVRESAGFALRGSNVGCEIEVPDDLWSVEIDEGQISQVIQNLVINADQAMPTGGAIRLRCDNVKLGAGDDMPLPAGRYVRIAVEDQGQGIARELRERIFEPYYTTKSSGSGLGLATAHSIVTKHEGHIRVTAAEGGGARFVIHLPAAGQAGRRRSSGARQTVGGQGRVLLMDDEPMVRRAAARMLAMVGYEVVGAEDGARALELFRQAAGRDEPFDVVIMDLTVPGGMGGEEALRELRRLDPDVPALVSSGYANAPVMADHAAHGFQGVVRKPYSMSELSTTVARVLRDARGEELTGPG